MVVEHSQRNAMSDPFLSCTVGDFFATYGVAGLVNVLIGLPIELATTLCLLLDTVDNFNSKGR